LAAIHAYLARTTALVESAFLLLLLLFLTGAALAVYFLVNPSRTWSAWFRVVGMAALVLLAQGVAIWFLAGFRAPYQPRPTELKAECLAHVSVLAKALRLYAADHGTFPPADSWSQAASERVDWHVKSRTKELLQCPSVPGCACAYGYNSALSSTTRRALQNPAQTIVIFETDADRNTAGGPELLPDEPRHLGSDNYGFADGHVRSLQRRKLGTDERGDPIWAKEPDADWVIWEPVLKKREEPP
jgi:prepilin-type processing-associated H-X9-DG protein